MKIDEEQFFSDCLMNVPELGHVYKSDLEFYEELMGFVFLGSMTFRALDDYKASLYASDHYYHRYSMFLETATGQYGQTVDEVILYSFIQNIEGIWVEDYEFYNHLVSSVGPKIRLLMRPPNP